MNSLPIITKSPVVSDIASKLPFRQSLIKDYMTCPQMAMYRWIYRFEEEDTFFSAVMGSAGHKVLYDMHSDRIILQRKRGSSAPEPPSFMDTLSQFNKAFEEQLEKEKVLPKVAAKFDTLLEQRDAMSEPYVEMIRGYMVNVTNQQFNSTLHEQSFVLEMGTEDAAGNRLTDHPILFTGTIDQAGYYNDGTFVNRDIKFRADNFRPTKIELDLDPQMSVYSYALRFGNPSCSACAPKYNHDTQDIKYDGPCATCRAKIGTTAWPMQYPERCELIWMRDFLRRKKDQYAKYKIDKTVKIKNPRTGRMVYEKVISDAWLDGYKEGDFCGPGVIVTQRGPAFLNVMMSDITRICLNIREGIFYRKAGDHCNFWCKHKETCLRSLELEMDDVTLEDAVASYATIDPFSD